ncbi:MAG TPA: RsmE family RNA methyltransferase [Fimbriimonadaceae bacterium]|nr:RsmE family RNA methyltransferase [Fimbriimonadaceae bacterium]
MPDKAVTTPLRALPRVFVLGATPDDPIELPGEEVDKLRKVLRLSAGAEIAVLPNDGSVIRCEFTGREAIPKSVERPEVEAKLQLTLAQALPKGDKVDEIVRAGTELGVARFILFPSERTVVQWDAKKVDHRLTRLATIAREAAEVSFRTRLPEIVYLPSMKAVFDANPDAVALSESERESKPLRKTGNSMTILVGPEGGWSRKELDLIGDRGVTLGPRVLRVDHAGPAAAAILLLDHE